MNTENVSTLKIHKLTREQYERELGAGRIDPTAIYLTPNEELLSIEQGGTGANNAADALVNLGAAPVEHLDDTNNPHGVTIEQIGAAPAGYGLGVNNVKMVSISDANNATDNGWYRMASSTANGIGAAASLFVIANENGYITQFAIQTSTGYILRRQCINGTWGEWEWEKPPMTLGVEYRTTERYLGKPIYRKALALGALPNASRGHYRWYIDVNSTVISVIMHGERRRGEGITVNGDEQYTGNVFIEPADNTIVATATPWTNGNDWYMDIRTSKDLTYLVNTWGEMRYTKE